MADNIPVQLTADDAAISKASASALGYYEDNFMGEFMTKSRVRRSPLINRGYYARVAAVRSVLRNFIKTYDGKCQIVSLGAGSDTTFFWMQDQNILPERYIEVDMLEVVQGKIEVIRKSDKLSSALNLSQEERDALGAKTVTVRVGSETTSTEKANAETATAGSNVAAQETRTIETGAQQTSSTTAQEETDNSEQVKTIRPNKLIPEHHTVYRLAAADLRKPSTLADAVCNVCQGDQELPTLFLSECVLVYVKPEHSAAVIKWCADNFKEGVFVAYEQIRPDDAFGRVMMENLKFRGCELLGIWDHPSPDAEIKRFTSLGWDSVTCHDMNDVYYKLIDKEDVKRAEKLEIFDEFEEWHLMQAHYCLVLARKGPITLERMPTWGPHAKEDAAV